MINKILILNLQEISDLSSLLHYCVLYHPTEKLKKKARFFEIKLYNANDKEKLYMFNGNG